MKQRRAFRPILFGASLGALGALLLMTGASSAVPGDQSALRIISIDVEGGAATLYATPQGHSLLIDTGWPTGMGGPRPAPGAPPPPPTSSSAERIAAAVKAAGLSRIDYLLITHYHVDHVGGVHDLIARIPIGTFIDHGPNREVPPATATAGQLANAPATLYPKYVAAIDGHKHIVMKAGDRLKIDRLELTAINSDGEPIAKPVRGAGESGVGCAAATSKTQDGGEENPRSLGILAVWGKARILSLGDTTWNLENRLACPTDLIGPVDLMFTNNHGSALSNSSVLVDTVRPTVVAVNNGATKGGDGEILDSLRRSPKIQGVWQLHFATRSPDKNFAADQIANPADGPDGVQPLNFTVDRSGAVTATNPRNGFTKTYPKAR